MPNDVSRIYSILPKKKVSCFSQLIFSMKTSSGKFLGTPRIEPGTAVWEANMLPLCYITALFLERIRFHHPIPSLRFYVQRSRNKEFYLVVCRQNPSLSLTFVSSLIFSQPSLKCCLNFLNTGHKADFFSPMMDIGFKAKLLLKGALVGGEPGIFLIFVYFLSQLQRLRPLSYCAPLYLQLG